MSDVLDGQERLETAIAEMDKATTEAGERVETALFNLKAELAQAAAEDREADFDKYADEILGVTTRLKNIGASNPTGEAGPPAPLPVEPPTDVPSTPTEPAPAE